MKLALVIFSLLFSSLAFAEFNCEVVAFGKVITGSGYSMNAAKVDARIKCIHSGNNQMFCTFDKMNCTATTEMFMTYCELVAFSDFYYSIQPNVSVAADEVRRQCLARQNPMFCTPDKIKCLDLR